MKSFYDWSAEQKLNEIALSPDFAMPTVAKPSLRLGSKISPDTSKTNIIPVVVHPKVLKWFDNLNVNSKILVDIFSRLREGDVGGMLLAHLSNEEVNALKNLVSEVQNDPNTILANLTIANHISKSIENGLRLATKNFAHHEEEQ